jgi:predicted nucleic acid-binding protein
MQRFVRDLGNNLQIVTPSERDWAESGQIVRKMAAHHSYDVQKTREIHFDVLIALCARRIGAVLITLNAADFMAILEFKDFSLECWRLG